MIRIGPRCMFCKHYDKKRPGRCAAFTGLIPAKIILCEAEHLTPCDGDHGIQFELDPNLNRDSLETYRNFFENSAH